MQQKIDKEAAKFIPKKKAKLKKKKEFDANDDKLDENFDESSLDVYGALLSEQLEKEEAGKEVAKPSKLVGEILSKQEKEKRDKIRREREKKARQILEDIPMTDEQQKESMIAEWTTYAEHKNEKSFAQLETTNKVLGLQ